MRTLIIAEAGVNHNGSLDLAKKLINASAEAGADIVKFQTFVASELVTNQAPTAEYQAAKGYANQLAMLRSLELSEAAHTELIAHCQRRNIEFLSTAFDPVSLRLLLSLRPGYVKVPSGEITNVPYLRAVASCALPILLSTGMSTLAEVGEAIQCLHQAGASRESITVLHCNSEYPTPFDHANLRAIQTLREAFGLHVGYSDHTMGFEAAVVAVALGATVIEKHITLDRNLPGPDHKASLEPADFGAMVRSIRNTEMALGDGVKRPSAGEAKNIVAARRSIVASRPIAAGEALTAENLTVKRPSNGLSPTRWDEVIGRKAKRGFQPDELIEL